MRILPQTSDNMMIRRGVMLACLSVSGGMVLGVPSTAQSVTNEKEPKALEEVVVTAQKRAQDIQDVPLAIAALSDEQLQDARIADMVDLSSAVPGFTVVSGFGAGRRQFVVRGISGERGSSALTGVYLDEMPVSGAQGQNYLDLRTVDLERVEVLKGPQGTLFGEGSVGGTVRLLTKDPQLERFGGTITPSFYHTEDGDWSEEITAVVNVPVVENKFGLRVAGTYEDKSGWIDQPSIGRKNMNGNEAYDVRVKSLWMPTDELAVRAMVVLHDNDGDGLDVVNQQPRRDSNFLQAIDRSASTRFVDEYQLYNLSVTYDFGFAELLSSSSYNESRNVTNYTQLLGSLPVPTLEILARNSEIDASMTAQEVRLTSAGDGALSWSLGGLFKKTEMMGPTLNVDANRNGASIARNSGAGRRPTNESESWAAFAHLSYKLTSRFEIGGGLRYFVDDRDTYDPTIANSRIAGDFDAVTFRTYASYAITDDMNIYVNVADGFRSGGFNTPNAVQRGAPSDYGPESVISYEAGLKGLLADGRFSFDTAVFHSEYEDMQADIIVPDANGAPLQFTGNQQTAECRGVELALTWYVLDNLDFGLSGVVVDSEFTKISSASPFLVGDPLDNVPDYSVAASGTYRFNLPSSISGFVRTDYNRQGESISASTRGLGVTRAFAGPIDFINASVGIERNGWEFVIFGRNLTDEDRATRAGRTGVTSQAQPRTVGAAITKHF